MDYSLSFNLYNIYNILFTWIPFPFIVYVVSVQLMNGNVGSSQISLISFLRQLLKDSFIHQYSQVIEAAMRKNENKEPLTRLFTYKSRFEYSLGAEIWNRRSIILGVLIHKSSFNH